MVHPLSMVASLWAAAAAAMVDVDGRYNSNNILVGCVCMCSDVFGDRTNTSEHIQTHPNTKQQQPSTDPSRPNHDGRPP